MQKINEYVIDIKDVFEGPLDLLMHLIRVNEIDIHDIPISFILKEYLKYLRTLETLDIDISSEFLVMVSTLLEIKSRMLLPTSYLDNMVTDEEWLASLADPRHELVRALVFNDIHRRLEEDLREHEYFQMRVFPAAIRSPEYQDNPDVFFDLERIGLYDLLTAYQQMLLKEKPKSIQIRMPAESLEAAIDELLNWYKSSQRASTYIEAVGERRHPARLIIVFLALLELAKMGKVELMQSNKKDEIILKWK